MSRGLTSSWRPFGPLDFVLCPLQALRCFVCHVSFRQEPLGIYLCLVHHVSTSQEPLEIYLCLVYHVYFQASSSSLSQIPCPCYLYSCNLVLFIFSFPLIILIFLGCCNGFFLLISIRYYDTDTN